MASFVVVGVVVVASAHSIQITRDFVSLFFVFVSVSVSAAAVAATASAVVVVVAVGCCWCCWELQLIRGHFRQLSWRCCCC